MNFREELELRVDAFALSILIIENNVADIISQKVMLVFLVAIKSRDLNKVLFLMQLSFLLLFLLYILDYHIHFFLS